MAESAASGRLGKASCAAGSWHCDGLEGRRQCHLGTEKWEETSEGLVNASCVQGMLCTPLLIQSEAFNKVALMSLAL